MSSLLVPPHIAAVRRSQIAQQSAAIPFADDVSAADLFKEDLLEKSAISQSVRIPRCSREHPVTGVLYPKAPLELTWSGPAMSLAGE